MTEISRFVHFLLASAKIQSLKEIQGGQLSTYSRFVQVLEKFTVNDSAVHFFIDFKQTRLLCVALQDSIVQ